jgi:hypothetical protein
MEKLKAKEADDSNKEASITDLISKLGMCRCADTHLHFDRSYSQCPFIFFWALVFMCSAWMHAAAEFKEKKSAAVAKDAELKTAEAKQAPPFTHII